MNERVRAVVICHPEKQVSLDAFANNARRLYRPQSDSKTAPIALDFRKSAAIQKGIDEGARLVQRARIVLLAADGMENMDIAGEVGTDRQTVGRWRTRFVKEGVRSIVKDRPRGGRKATKRQAVAQQIIQKTTREKPSNATHWSTRTLAAELGIDHTIVHRV